MGSYNLFCAATGIPLTYTDSVAAFRVKPIEGKYGRGVPGDILTASHFIVSWPILGKYEDCGIFYEEDGKVYGERRNREWIKDEEKYEDPDYGEYMIFHRFAWETMMAADKRERERHKKWMDEYYTTNGKPDWVVEEAEEVESLIKEQEQRVTDPENYVEPARYGTRGYELMFWSPEGEHPHTAFWRAGFHKSEEPRMYYEAYKAVINPMHSIRSTFGFDFRPSIYAGQEVDYKGLHSLHWRAAEHCRQHMGDDE